MPAVGAEGCGGLTAVIRVKAPLAALGGCTGLLLSPPENLSCWELAWLHRAHTMPGGAGPGRDFPPLLPSAPNPAFVPVSHPIPLRSTVLQPWGCSSGVCLLRKSPGVLWDASEGRNPRIGSAGRRRRIPQGEIHVPNPLFDDLGAIIPFPLSSQGGHQEVEGFLSCRKKEGMTLIPP